MKIISVVGARPNFMKIAPFVKEIEKYNQSLISPSPPRPLSPSSTPRPITHILVHTGQHYDHNMSKTFFDDLELPEADINLEIGSGTHAEQVGQTMIAFEKVLKREKPDWVVVVGDVNATLACSVTAKKEWIKCCHIEAGLRSGDITMPEEINRLVTDRLSDLLLTPDRLSSENLRKEGSPENRIVFVGNIMIDTLEANRHKASQLDINEIIKFNLINHQSEKSDPKRKTQNAELHPPLPPSKGELISRDLQHEKNGFAVITIHRPSNVDTKETFESITRFLMDEVAKDLTLIWPIHPRAKKQLIDFGFYNEVVNHPNLILLQPLGYFNMLKLNMGARIVLTDSGGLQEECTILGTPCLTLRQNTERPITLKEHGGTCTLVGNNIERIRSEYSTALNNPRNPFRPELWDGHTAERCLEAILNYKG